MLELRKVNIMNSQFADLCVKFDHSIVHSNLALHQNSKFVKHTGLGIVTDFINAYNDGKLKDYKQLPDPVKEYAKGETAGEFACACHFRDVGLNGLGLSTLLNKSFAITKVDDPDVVYAIGFYGGLKFGDTNDVSKIASMIYAMCKDTDGIVKDRWGSDLVGILFPRYVYEMQHIKHPFHGTLFSVVLVPREFLGENVSPYETRHSNLHEQLLYTNYNYYLDFPFTATLNDNGEYSCQPRADKSARL